MQHYGKGVPIDFRILDDLDRGWAAKALPIHVTGDQLRHSGRSPNADGKGGNLLDAEIGPRLRVPRMAVNRCRGSGGRAGRRRWRHAHDLATGAWCCRLRVSPARRSTAGRPRGASIHEPRRELPADAGLHCVTVGSRPTRFGCGDQFIASVRIGEVIGDQSSSAHRVR